MLVCVCKYGLPDTDPVFRLAFGTSDGHVGCGLACTRRCMQGVFGGCHLCLGSFVSLHVERGHSRGARNWRSQSGEGVREVKGKSVGIGFGRDRLKVSVQSGTEGKRCDEI